MLSVTESLTSKPGNSVRAVSLRDMPADIILRIADITDTETLNSLSRTSKGLLVLLQGHRENDAKVLRAVEKGDVDDLKTILQSPSATARGGLGFLAKVVKEHTTDMDSMLANAEKGRSGTEPLDVWWRPFMEKCRERLSKTVMLVRILLEAGAEINGCDNLGFTALHWAARCTSAGNTGDDLVGLLLDFGADINSMGMIGTTPLHFAVSRASRGIAVRLIGAGANVHSKDSKDKYGLTPLRLAAMEPSTAGTWFFGVLESAGAVINIAGNRGYPLSPMCSEGCFYHYHDSSCMLPHSDRVRLVPHLLDQCFPVDDYALISEVNPYLMH